MDAIEFFSKYTLVDFLSFIALLIACFLGYEKLRKTGDSVFSSAYNKRRNKEKELSELDKHTQEIKLLIERIDELANLMNKQYLHLEKKIDENKARLDDFEESSEKRDLAILRDRLVQGIRFFKRNVKEDGFVHINITDYESLSHLFNEYFACGGNGTVGSMYNTEFKTWKIDN